MALHAGANEPAVMESFVGLPTDKSELGNPDTAASRCALCDLQFFVLGMAVLIVLSEAVCIPGHCTEQWQWHGLLYTLHVSIPLTGAC